MFRKIVELRSMSTGELGESGRVDVQLPGEKTAGIIAHERSLW